MPTAPKQFRPKWAKTPKQAEREYDKRRGSARARGYTRRWEKFRKEFRKIKQPLCARCLLPGHTILGVELDHIEPVQGADDPRFFDATNLQWLCADCHKVKTGEDRRDGKTRRVR